MRRRWLVVTSLVAAFAFVAAACGDDDTTDTTAGTTTTTTADTTTTTADPGEDIAFDVGVIPDPCPDAVNEGNGCIYLGIISDLTSPIFGPLGEVLTRAQEHFWDAINQAGGLDGFDVLITAENTFDAMYDTTGPLTAEGYELMVDRVLAFAQILGTPQTQSVIDRMQEDQVVAAPANWWSGWAFADEGGTNVLESAAPYCFEAMNGMTVVHGLMVENFGEDFTWALIRFPGDYGGDYSAGAEIAASQLGMSEPLFTHQQIPIGAGGNVDGAVGQMLQHRPDLVVIVTGPLEMAQIIGGTYGTEESPGHQRFQALGAAPTWNVALLGQSDLFLTLLQAVYFATTPYGGWETDSAGHAAMRAAAEERGQGPHNAYIAGWVWQYPILSLLTAAIASGDLRRGNLLALVQEIEVDYGGMLPPKVYAGDPNEVAVRHSIVNRVDPNSADGLTPITEEFTSPLTAAFPFEGACFTG